MTGPVEVVPAELGAAAEPLRAAARALRSVADDRRGLRELLDTVPSAVLRTSAEQALEAYELVAWELAQVADDLAFRLAWAGTYYAERERRTAAALPVTTPRADLPPLRDPAPGTGVPRPAPGPAPAPPS